MASSFLEIARRLAAQWFCSRLHMTFPFCFPFCFGDDEGDGLLFGFVIFFYFFLQGAIEKTMMLTLVFLGFYVCICLCFLALCIFSLCFLGFLSYAP